MRKTVEPLWKKSLGAGVFLILQLAGLSYSSLSFAANVEIVHYICKPDRHTLYVGTSVVDEAMIADSQDITSIDNLLTDDKRIRYCSISPEEKVEVHIFSTMANFANDNVSVSINGKVVYDLTFDEFGHDRWLIIEDYNRAQFSLYESRIVKSN